MMIKHLMFVLFTLYLLTACVLPTRPPPVPPHPSWQLILQDEFNNTQLDSTKWNTCYPWANDGCTNDGNHEGEWYLPDEVLLGDGLLRLRAEARTIKATDGKTYLYRSGMISSHDKFAVQNGYIEIRAKMPRGRGFWPAFWLLPANGEWPPEIDVLEVLGDAPNIVYMTQHYTTTTSPYEQDGKSYTGPDFAADFHIFAVKWSPDSIIWLVDGVEQRRSQHDIPQEPMYLIANLAVGGDWPGYPDDETIFPGYFDIDYIHVYQNPANAGH